MKKIYFAVGAIGVVLATPSYAGDINTARGVVDAVREADAPSVSTETKASPVGQSASEYKPTPPAMNIVEPPSPVNRMNPTGDADVQRGIDTYQQPNR